MLYAALPLTLAVVGTLAVTFLVVEVIVPAVREDQQRRRRRRGRFAERRDPALVSASREESGSTAVATGARTASRYGYEVRKRRPQPHRTKASSQVRAGVCPRYQPYFSSRIPSRVE